MHQTKHIIDRSKMPDIHVPKNLTLPAYEKIQLKNGMPVYLINMGVQEVVRVEWVFNAGRWHESQKHVARFTNRMLREGTTKFSSLELSEQLDFLGINFRNVSTVDHASLSVISLNKYLPDALDIVEQMLKYPAFHQHELEILINNQKEKLRVDLQKNEFIADQKMNVLLYGENHPYGYESEEKNYDVVNTDLLRAHHAACYNAANGFIMVSGLLPENIVPLLEQRYGGDDWKGVKLPERKLPFEPTSDFIYEEKKPDAYQSAIRFCSETIGKTHPDYLKLSITNTILGGYFGSRLMSNIREEKGYTYGIYSGITNSLRSSYFFISTEVGVDVSDDAVQEIISEINRLKNEPVSEAELELVRNYLTGKLLGNFDSPFNVAAAYKNLFVYGLDTDYLHRMMQTIHAVTAEDFKEMANKYFDLEKMYRIVIG